jgi:hypothetical protein
MGQTKYTGNMANGAAHMHRPIHQGISAIEIRVVERQSLMTL